MSIIKPEEIPHIFHTWENVHHIMGVCEQADVTEVVAANHHGMIFLLAKGGRNNGGIVYRDDLKTYEEMKSLAMSINAHLRASAWANTPASPEKEKHPQPQIAVDSQIKK